MKKVLDFVCELFVYQLGALLFIAIIYWRQDNVFFAPVVDFSKAFPLLTAGIAFGLGATIISSVQKSTHLDFNEVRKSALNTTSVMRE